MKSDQLAIEDLRGYERAVDLVDLAEDTAVAFPKLKRYGLLPEWNRVAVSALNMATGSSDMLSRCNYFLQNAIHSNREQAVCPTNTIRTK